MSNSQPVLVFNSGAGRTGKTSVVNAIKAMAPVFGRKVVSMPSITRSVYAELGIPDEGTALDMSVDMQLRLQAAINAKYYSSAEEFLKASQDADMVMIDRSPYDHISYFLHGMMMHTTVDEVKGKIEHANEWMAMMGGFCSKQYIVNFPFPEPWHTETQSSDGFRRDPSGKNLVWAMLLDKLLLDASWFLRGRGITFMTFPEQGMTVDARARYLLETCK